MRDKPLALGQRDKSVKSEFQSSLVITQERARRHCWSVQMQTRCGVYAPCVCGCAQFHGLADYLICQRKYGGMISAPVAVFAICESHLIGGLLIRLWWSTGAAQAWRLRLCRTAFTDILNANLFCVCCATRMHPVDQR